MSLILNIDTAIEKAIISIASEGRIIGFTTNNNQKDHASFLQPAIKQLLENANRSITELTAVAVTAGPGSYTGLRVSMASAKGLCYALHIPLILINTLEMMALSAIKQAKDTKALYCPMIDARRMEVFTAVYDHSLKEIIIPCSMIVDENFLKDISEKNTIYYSGNGIIKLKNIQKQNALFIDSEIDAISLQELSWKKFQGKKFSNLFYSTPDYLKEFYTTHIQK